jgi:aspartate/tyrosine/aromatic aminotransferase
MEYNGINDVGKQWIRKYTLALVKELLGAIREKYSNIPIPGSEVSLDGAALRSEAQTEKEALMTQLRETLEELSRKIQFENRNNEANQHQEMLRKVPLAIYIG